MFNLFNDIFCLLTQILIQKYFLMKVILNLGGVNKAIQYFLNLTDLIQLDPVVYFGAFLHLMNLYLSI